MSEEIFLSSDNIKSKKIILNEKDLEQDISSLSFVDTALHNDHEQDISSLNQNYLELKEIVDNLSSS